MHLFGFTIEILLYIYVHFVGFVTIATSSIPICSFVRALTCILACLRACVELVPILR